MHTFKATNGTVFHHNSDLSGDVIIQKGNEKIEIYGEDILEFVTSYIRQEKIAEIEQADLKSLLNIASKNKGIKNGKPVRKHDPKWKDNTRTARSDKRKAELKASAKLNSFETWSGMMTYLGYTSLDILYRGPPSI